MTVLLLRLAGPLQSWGSAARFARRSTENAPTKSGVLGLLAAAEGRPRGADLSDLAALRFGVRIDQPGSRLRDFQTAHHADSGKAMPLSERFYLTDAVFVAAVEGDRGLIMRLDLALTRPYYLPYLGRRSCPPSRPIRMGDPIEDATLEEALSSAAWQASPWYVREQDRAARRTGSRRAPEDLDLMIDCLPSEIPHLQFRDQPLSFAPEHRQYGLRGVRTEHVPVPSTAAAAAPVPGHDPTAGLRPAPPAARTRSAEDPHGNR
ncbi:type I-E CRISPR-associated protein Cas5/CasD [Streptomyces sp. NPDC097619]|uniref:type I-E CRISPR-associated protein Cas5/CasD n=1 Tax=Streptomyces sp. NPDC097619 TaxID=3157228 RepID=UPI00332F00D7